MGDIIVLFNSNHNLFPRKILNHNRRLVWPKLRWLTHHHIVVSVMNTTKSPNLQSKFQGTSYKEENLTNERSRTRNFGFREIRRQPIGQCLYQEWEPPSLIPLLYYPKSCQRSNTQSSTVFNQHFRLGVKPLPPLWKRILITCSHVYKTIDQKKMQSIMCIKNVRTSMTMYTYIHTYIHGNL